MNQNFPNRVSIISSPVWGRVREGADPQSYNRYSYCLNNPLKYVDPSGYTVDLDKVIDDLLNSPHGGSWSPTTGTYYYHSEEEAYGFGISFMHEHGYSYKIVSRRNRGYNEWKYPWINPGNGKFQTEPIYAWVLTEEEEVSISDDWLFINTIDAEGNPQSEGAYIDVTEAFDDQLEKTMVYFSIYRDWFDINYPKEGLRKETDKMIFFRSKVNDNSVFDIKRTAFSRANLGAEYGIYRGQEFRYDDFGNYNYGVAAKYFGLTLDKALLGAGLNQISKLNPDFENPEGFFDHGRDTEMIIRGYNHKW